WPCPTSFPGSAPTATIRTNRCRSRGAPDMQITAGQLRDFIRSIHARPNGTGALLNLVRASEVRGAADLTCLADVIADEELRMDVTRHAADEARHAYLLVRRMQEIGFAPSRLPAAVDRTEAVVAQCHGRDVKQ